MKGIKIIVAQGILCLISLNTFPQDKKEYFRFEVSRKGLETRVSSDELEMTARFLKPSSIPESSEPESWKIISESSVVKSLGGVTGHLNNVSWSLNTGQVDCETWISDTKDLVAFRQTFTNKIKKPVYLNNLYPLFIDGKGSFSFGAASDWRILEQFRHKNDLPKSEAPAVYCTWYYHADNYNEEIFKGDIAQFKKEHLPFDVFLIDECWDVNDWGDFEAISSFPSGMKWAAGQINSAGYKAGIWTAPFLVDGESDLSKNHPSWLLKNSKGELCTFNMNDRDHYILDLTYPGVCDYLEEQFRKISRDWGYGYFKFDFMRSVFIDSDQQFYDKSATSLEAYRRGLEAIRRGTGKDAYISVCGGHYGASFGIANTQRSGSDVKSQWNEKELPKYRQNILRTWMAGLWHVDPDAMMVRRQSTALETDKRGLTTGLFTDEEAFTNTVNQFIGGNLITFTEDFAKIDEDRKMLYRHIIPSVNSASRPLDLFNLACPEIMLTHISPVCEKLGSWNMLTIINWTNGTKDYHIKLDHTVTGNLNGDHFLVYDFQSGEIIAHLSETETLNLTGVKGHQSKLLKIVAWDGKSPMFLGTDLSFSCGGVEIADINYNKDRISGKLETGWVVPVRLTFVIPGISGYELRKVETVPGQTSFSVNF